MNRLASTLLLSLFGTLLPLEATLADDDAPALSYAAPNSEWMRLDNGVVLEGSDLSSLDTNTTGFRLTAGFSPEQLPRWISVPRSPIAKVKKSPLLPR